MTEVIRPRSDELAAESRASEPLHNSESNFPKEELRNNKKIHALVRIRKKLPLAAPDRWLIFSIGVLFATQTLKTLMGTPDGWSKFSLEPLSRRTDQRCRSTPRYQSLLTRCHFSLPANHCQSRSTTVTWTGGTHWMHRKVSRIRVTHVLLILHINSNIDL
jgi:hypothetical protein